MLHIKYQSHQSIGSREEDFKRFFTVFGCDLEGLNILGMKEALYEIWIQLAQWLPRRCLKLSKCESPGSKVRE